MEWGIFNDDSADWTADEAVEAQFYSREEAEAALADRYSDDDSLVIHAVEEIDDEEDADDEGEEDEDDSESHPVKY